MTEPELDDEPFLSSRVRRRLATALAVLLVLILLVILPPLISVRRYQKRVAQAISASLGRPVHFDDITVQILPFPGFTITNFVVSERPEFGAEPVLRAQTVEARLRFASLWRRRVEISRISLESPHINLVRNAAGRWNVQSIVTQASQLQSAPTAQARASETPRFPYIEASDARLNLKQGEDKLPFSFTGADLSLWIGEPGEWHLRFAGQPVRTDTNVSDTGQLHVEATLSRAANLPDAKIDLHANWQPTPLGQATLLAVGNDLNWRGDAAADLSLTGTLGQAKAVANLHISDLRRADFVPAHTLDLQAHCEAVATGVLHALRDVRCALPTRQDTSVLDAFALFRQRQQTAADAPDVLSLKAEVPDVADWRTADLQVELQRGSPNYFLDWLRLFSQRIPADLSLGGSGGLGLQRLPSSGAAGWTGALECRCVLPASALPVPASPGEGPSARHTEAAQGAETREREHRRWTIRISHSGAPLLGGSGYLQVEAAPSAGGVAANDTGERNAPQPSAGAEAHAPAPEQSSAKPEDTFALDPSPLPSPTITGQITRSGYTILYSSLVDERQAAAVLPPLGDALPANATTGAIKASRTWGGPQTWNVPAPPAVSRKASASAIRNKPKR